MWVGKVADMVVKIHNEHFTDVTLAIGDTYGDDIRVGGGVRAEMHQGGWQDPAPGK